MSCSRCAVPLVLEDRIKCSVCENNMHFGCGGLVETSFRKLPKDRKVNFKCQDCKVNKVGCGDGSVLMAQFNKLADELRNSMSELEKSVKYGSDQSDAILTEFQELKKTFQTMQGKQQELMNENAVLKKTVKELKSQFIEVDQRSLDHNVEINGVPETVQEDRILPLLCDVLSIPPPDVTQYTVKRSRVGAPGRIKSVLVQFESKYTRNQILKASKRLKPKASQLSKDSKDIGNIYVNEELTPQNKLLFFNANKVKKEKQFKYLWVAEGNILLKKTEESRTIRVRDIEDLN